MHSDNSHDISNSLIAHAHVNTNNLFETLEYAHTHIFFLNMNMTPGLQELLVVNMAKRVVIVLWGGLHEPALVPAVFSMQMILAFFSVSPTLTQWSRLRNISW